MNNIDTVLNQTLVHPNIQIQRIREEIHTQILKSLSTSVWHDIEIRTYLGHNLTLLSWRLNDAIYLNEFFE